MSKLISNPSISELRKICQTPESAKHDSAIGGRLVRKISIYFTRVFIITPISANQITFLMLLVGLAAGTLFIFGHYWYSLAGSLLLPIMYILDGSDGEVARYKNSCSLKGVYLDRITHILTYPYLFVGVTFGAYISHHDVRIFIFGFLAALFFSIIEITNIEKKIILARQPQKTDSYIQRAIPINSKIKSLFIRLIAFPIKIARLIPDIASIDTLIALLFVGTVFNILYIILIIYGCLLPIRWLLSVTLDMIYQFSP